MLVCLSVNANIWATSWFNAPKLIEESLRSEEKIIYTNKLHLQYSFRHYIFAWLTTKNSSVPVKKTLLLLISPYLSYFTSQMCFIQEWTELWQLAEKKKWNLRLFKEAKIRPLKAQFLSPWCCNVVIIRPINRGIDSGIRGATRDRYEHSIWKKLIMKSNNYS